MVDSVTQILVTSYPGFEELFNTHHFSSSHAAISKQFLISTSLSGYQWVLLDVTSSNRRTLISYWKFSGLIMRLNKVLLFYRP